MPRVTSVKIIAADSKYSPCITVSKAEVQSGCSISTNTRNIPHRPDNTAAPAPKAMRLSIFGPPCTRRLNPLVKNRRLMDKTGNASKNCVRAKIPGLRRISGGIGSENIPLIATYTSGSKKTSDAIKRYFKRRASSFAARCGERTPVSSPGAKASYPAPRTAAMISCAVRRSSSYSAVSVFCNKLTDAYRIPGNLATARSTCAWQAEQVMPVTLNFFFIVA